MVGTGFFPTERSNIYQLEEDGLFLTGTSEVALAGLHMGEILDAAELPLRYCGFSTCFRRESGAAGRDTRGMFRVHQFNKVEMFVFTSAEDAWAEHERMVALEEELLSQLGLPYRVVNVAAGDLGAPAAKKIDIEAWFPSQGRYREVTSCSNTTDFQARRLGIRVRGEGGTGAAAHPERNGRDRPRGARDSGELPGRGARTCCRRTAPLSASAADGCGHANQSSAAFERGVLRRSRRRAPSRCRPSAFQTASSAERLPVRFSSRYSQAGRLPDA